MFEVWFLSVLAIVWIIFSVISDLRKNEIPNWIFLSLIVFALSFRLFYFIFDSSTGFMFFVNGLLGLAVFFVLGSLLYYGRMFAGGDAKLFFALGTVLPFSSSIQTNFKSFGIFLLLFLLAGALWGLASITYYILTNFKNFRREMRAYLKNNKKILFVSFLLALLSFAFGFLESIFFYFALFIFVLPSLYFSAKSIDNVCMIKKVSPEKLVPGDWIAEDVKIKGKKIVSGWEGLSEENINEIRKHRKEVKVQYGVPFTPAFLISLLAFMFLEFYKEISFLGIF